MKRSVKDHALDIICLLFVFGGLFLIYTAFQDKDEITRHDFIRKLTIGCGCILFFGGSRLFTTLLKKQDLKNATVDLHSNVIIIKSDFRKNLLLFFGCSLFVLMGYFLVAFPEEFHGGSNITKIIFGSIAIVFFGFGLIISLREMFLGKTSLRIDDKRITYTVPLGKFNFEWNHIDGFSELGIMNNRLIVIALKNEQVYLRNLRGIKGFLARLNAKNFGAAFTITSKNFKISHTQLLELLNKKLTEHIQRT